MPKQREAHGLSVAFKTIWVPVGWLSDDRALYVPLGDKHMVTQLRGTLHATVPTTNQNRRKTLDTVCGKRAYPMILVASDEHALVPIWPPPIRLGDAGRCRECWQETGRKRPHKMFRELTVTPRADT